MKTITIRLEVEFNEDRITDHQLREAVRSAAFMTRGVHAVTEEEAPLKVEFSTREYRSNHGAMPRGFGTWGFVAREHWSKPDYLDHVVHAEGIYSAAKARAAAVFSMRGISEVVVCP
jgi:hypothetical protein